MRPHAFIAMPFGTKPDAEGRLIDFNRVFTDYLRPALEAAGLEVFRADQEQRAGDIRADMFQELLVADLVVVDLTVDNPNVWYELGVRHALRARGVVLVQGPRATQPFDVYTDRKLCYSLRGGVPDAAALEADRARLTAMARETMATSTRRRVSPVFQLIPSLQQPEWRQLLLVQRSEFSEAHEQWASRMEVARQKNRPGDILVLAGEAPIRALRLEASRGAGQALLRLEHYAFALEQFEAALALDPDDKLSREQKAVCLGRLGRREEARAWVDRLIEDYPADPDCLALTGRLAKTAWVQRWREAGAASAQWRTAASGEDASLREAIEPYQAAFVQDPSDYYSGINALTLRMLQLHLGGSVDQASLANLQGGVRWACLAARERQPKDYWVRASMAELSLLFDPPESVTREYRTTVAAAGNDGFALGSARETLALLQALEFRPDVTAAVLDILDREIARVAPAPSPRNVYLFSGHRLDAPDRPRPRFPSDKVYIATTAIGRALEQLGAGQGDLALTQGASGGDLIFAEACIERGVRVQLLLPMDEPEFIERSIRSSTDGESWRRRYFAVKERLADLARIMPHDLGGTPKEMSPFERCNLWLLYTALAYGIDKVHFVALWDGGGADGPGGTAHMYDEVKRRTGQVTWLDTRTLW